MFEEVPPLSPLAWFSFSLPLKKLSPEAELGKKKYLLFSPAFFHDEKAFSKIHMGWNEEGIYLQIRVEHILPEVVYPDFRRGDSVELFFDTRDLKNKSYFHSFCHHFVFFPEKVEGFLVKELSSFRGEEFHPLVDPKEIAVEVDIQKKFYLMDIKIPSYALHGFDPTQFQRFGFTYQVNRRGGLPQSFATSSENFFPEKNPHLWASFVLENA